MIIANRIKAILLFASLLYLTFYIPMTLTFYLPYWMEFNCGVHKRCEEIGLEKSKDGIRELASYFRHQGELDSFITTKEKTHLKEVRGIFDKMFLFAVAALIIVFLTYNRRLAARYALINAVVIIALLLVLPFFGTFWREIFHPLIFDNDLWKNNKYDLSFYIMPRVFFKYTVALLIVACFLINIAIWAALRSKSK